MADTNVLISALIKEGVTRHIIQDLKEKIILPTYVLEECERHLSLVQERTGLDSDAIAGVLQTMTSEAIMLPNEAIAAMRTVARRALDHIDQKDSPILAAALVANACIWSDDKHFQQQPLVRVYTTKELFRRLYE